MIVNEFKIIFSGDLENIKFAQDFLDHEPYLLHAIPAFKELLSNRLQYKKPDRPKNKANGNKFLSCE